MRKIKFFAVLFLSLCLVLSTTGCSSVRTIWHKLGHKEDALHLSNGRFLTLMAAGIRLHNLL